MVRKQGKRGLVLYLKTCHTMLMQGVPGSQLRPASREISKVAVSSGGNSLPRIIPAYARSYIRRGDVTTLRLWLTLLGVYRIVLLMDSRPNYNTITAKGLVLSTKLLKEWISFTRKRFIPGLQMHTGLKLLDIKTDVLERPALVAIVKASADKAAKGAAETSFATRWNSADRWVSGEWGWSLFRYLSLVKGGTGTTQSLWTKMSETSEMKSRVRANQLAPTDGSSTRGRLSEKVEPAGKVRVFAIVDYWTQISLKPLHNFLFEILKEIPQDGTFDQLQPVKRLLKKVGANQTIHSYDLSAATDRIPVLIQGLLLAQIFGRQFASCWRALLCNRPFWLGKLRQKYHRLPSPYLTYAVGQPMGAYSSWGMLALVHHAMVQFAAYRVGYTAWFDLYTVLGDDVTIAEDRVAQAYVALCAELGVGIGMAKSLVAKGRTLEFAKKFFFRGEDCSGLPIKFWAAAQHSVGVAHALSSWYPAGTLANFVRALGVGFKGASRTDAPWGQMANRMKILLVLLTHPLTGGRFAAKTWVDWLMSKSPVDFHFDENRLNKFTPWATGLQEEVIRPARERIEDLQEDIFFKEHPFDPAQMAVDATANESVVSTQTSLDKAEESMKHLQKLDVKFNVVQCSAIFSQVVRAVGKVDLISPTSTQALKRDKETKIVSVTGLYQLWIRLRSRIAELRGMK